MRAVLASAVLMTFFSLSTTAMAHVVVRPAEVSVAKYQVFTTSVPNEKEVPTTRVRLLIPEGLEHVSPTVKPGWTITINKSGEGEDERVSEIIWSGGSIPEGQRDEFTFSAKVPASETTLQWKAYQLYQDGEEVTWDQEVPDASSDSHTDIVTNPLSETQVIDDLAIAAEVEEEAPTNALDVSIVLSLLAVALSVWAVIQTRK